MTSSHGFRARRADDRTPHDLRRRHVAVGLCLGVAIGAGIGIAMDNPAVGMGAGIALGVAIGLIRGRRQSGLPAPAEDARDDA